MYRLNISNITMPKFIGQIIHEIKMQFYNSNLCRGCSLTGVMPCNKCVYLFNFVATVTLTVLGQSLNKYYQCMTMFSKTNYQPMDKNLYTTIMENGIKIFHLPKRPQK